MNINEDKVPAGCFLDSSKRIRDRRFPPAFMEAFAKRATMLKRLASDQQTALYCIEHGV